MPPGPPAVRLAAFVWGATLIGCLCGLLPLVAAAVRRHHGLAVGGFIACLAMGLAMGVLGALPTAIVFTIAIVTRPAGEGGSTAPD